MKCPVCKSEMIGQDFGGIIVDVCKDGCKGIWFDWLELIKLDETNEGCGNALKDALNESRVNDENRGQIKCPRCDVSMHTHKYQSAKKVNVDECYNCAGFFLDSGELKEIRDNFMSEQELEEYMNKLLNDIPAYQEAQSNLEKEGLRAKAVRKFTRFMRLSHYKKEK